MKPEKIDPNVSRMLVISTMNGFPWGGSEELWFETVQAALDQGTQVDVIVFRNAPLYPKLEALRERVRLYFIESPKPIIPSLGIRLWHKLRSKPVNFSYQNRFFGFKPSDYDLILLSAGSAVDVVYYPDLYDWLHSCIQQVQIIVHLVKPRHFLTDEQRNQLRILYSRCQALFFVSQKNRTDLQHVLAVTLSHARIVQNPVNLRNPGIVSWPQQEALTVALVGRIDVEHKGQDILFAALSDSSWRNRQVMVNVYGRGPHEGYLNELASFYGISDRVFFHGHVTDVRSIWSANQILILPSLVEGLPLTVVEAMLCGRAVLVSEAGDSRCLVEHGTNGFVYKGFDAASLAVVLEEVWDKRHQLSQMGQQAYQTITAWLDAHPGQTFFDLLRAARLTNQ